MSRLHKPRNAALEIGLIASGCVMAGVALMLLVAAAALSGTPRVLRICADPNNLPYSNAAREGFENRIAERVVRALGATAEYDWQPQRRGYLRRTLNAGACDLVPGTASGVERLATTQPYYRSSYMFVSRADEPLDDLRSLDDPRLQRLRIGVQMIGNDATNTPPAHALAARGIVANVRGFMISGDYRQPAPQSAIVDAVADGELDVAIVWGPLAGYFGSREAVALRLQPVAPAAADARWPMRFAIAMGVRRGDEELRQAVDAALLAEAPAIATILADYGVPTVD